MSEVFTLGSALLAGLLLGMLFFGGLLWTVRKGISSGQPARWFIVSSLLRMAIVLGGFYLVSAGHWERLLVCVAGFFIARVIMTRVTRAAEKASDSKKEVRHAPQSR